MKNKYIKNTIILFFLIFAPYLIIGVPDNLLFIITNLLIIVISAVSMLIGNYAFSLRSLFFVFVYFFFGVIPVNDLINSNVYYGGGPVLIENILLANFIILLGIFSFVIGGRIGFKKIRLFDVFLFGSNLNDVSLIRLTLVFAFSVIAIVVYNDFNFLTIFFRGLIEGSNDVFDDNQILKMIYSNFIRPIPILCLFYIVYSIKKFGNNLPKKILFAIIFISCLIVTSPISMPRYQAAALYLPFIVIFTTLWNSKNAMPLSIIFSLLIVMPFLDNFRYFDLNNISFKINLSSMNHGHFDAFQNLTRVMELNFITYGNQLLGVILFFIPRSSWPDKPIGSGAELADLAGYSFANISMPLIAEGYVNFGIFGVIVFMFSIGAFVVSLDNYSWRLIKSNKNNFFVYYYYSLFGMFFFILRGDLLSSVAYTMGLTSAFILVNLLCKGRGLNVRLFKKIYQSKSNRLQM